MLFDLNRHEKEMSGISISDMPDTLNEAVPVFADYIDKMDSAMRSLDLSSAATIRETAWELAKKVQGGRTGVSGPEGAGTRLQEATAAPWGKYPKWGQAGTFRIRVQGILIDIETRGFFEIGGSRDSFGQAFSANFVERHARFISDTGFRSFISASMVNPPRNLSLKAFCAASIDWYCQDQLDTDNLPMISPDYGKHRDAKIPDWPADVPVFEYRP